MFIAWSLHIYTFIYIVSKNMQYKRMCVWENSSAASKEKNSIPILYSIFLSYLIPHYIHTGFS